MTKVVGVSPVVVEPIVSDEKLGELLALGTEYPELDFKEMLDLDDSADLVELAKDVGAMQVKGGYLVYGVDNNGNPTGVKSKNLERLADEAILSAKLQKYLPSGLTLHCKVLLRNEASVVLVYIGPHPDGCAVFECNGQYPVKDKKKPKVVFRAGDIFWRNGTSSERVNQQGIKEILARGIAGAKAGWFNEHDETLQKALKAMQEGLDARQVVEGPLGAINIAQDEEALTASVLELARKDDSVAFKYLLFESTAAARETLDDDVGLGRILDKLVCLAAVLLEYDLTDWFKEVVGALSNVYAEAAGDNAQIYNISGQFAPDAPEPRVWLQVIERVFALGALAVRRRKWLAVRALVTERPEGLDAYYPSWLWHALVMGSRADRLQERTDNRTKEISLLSLSRAHISRLPLLRPDPGIDAENTQLDSLAQFDALACLVAIDERSGDNRGYYPNFARFYAERVTPVLTQLLTDPEMHFELLTFNDEALARALLELRGEASRIGVQYVGFQDFNDEQITEWIDHHLPAEMRQSSP